MEQALQQQKWRKVHNPQKLEHQCSGSGYIIQCQHGFDGPFILGAENHQTKEEGQPLELVKHPNTLENPLHSRGGKKSRKMLRAMPMELRKLGG